MKGFSVHIFLFLIPGIAANVIHMIVVKKNLFSFMAEPLSARYFGENKTIRGFVFLSLSMGAICLFESMLTGPFTSGYLSDFLIGAGLGFSYMLSELPNSFIKRMTGIPSGGSSSRFRLLQSVADKSDSLIGACIFYFIVMDIRIKEILLLFVISLFLNFAISMMLVSANLKRSL